MRGWLAVLGLGLAVAGCGPDRHPKPPPGDVHVVPRPRVDDLSAQLAPIRDAEKLPGLAMAVWRHGRLVAIGATGERKSGDVSAPVTVDDQWHLGSDTKAMTATLIGIYVDRGVLHWDDTIDKLFTKDKIDAGYAKVTLDQLLGHRGGAPSQPPDALWSALWAAGKTDPAAARAAFVSGILAGPPAQPVGTYAYSNAGYMIAGAALERATGKPWEELIVADLFTPLGMTSCGFGAPGTGTSLDQPWGHQTHGSGATLTVVPMAPNDPGADNPPGLGPAGTVHCSLADWGKFLVMHAGATSPLLTAATFAHLHTPLPGAGQPYGFGWLIVTANPGDVRYYHEGDNTMWRAIAIVVPILDEAIAVAANRSDDTLLPAITPLAQKYLTKNLPNP